MHDKPSVSVIIPTYHDWDRLKLCLSALEKQLYPADQFEVLVVNNDPCDLPPYEVTSGNVRLLHEAKPGSYAARNAAIKIAKGGVFAFTDSDCIPDKYWLMHGLSEIESGADRVGGAVALFTDGHKTNNLPTAFQICAAFRQKQNVASGWAVTANMIAKRKCFDEVGLFDDKMLSGGDHEWGKRAGKHGHNILFSKKSIVNHPIRSTWDELFMKQKRLIGGSVRLNKKNSRISQAKFYAKQMLPPFNSWAIILRDNKSESAHTIFKAMATALILKYYGLFFMLKIITKSESESRV